MRTAAARMGGERRRGFRGRGRYSHFVEFMRYGLPLTAMVLIALVVFWPQVMGGYGSLIAPVFTAAQVEGLDVMRMANARYVGRTSDARPYEVTAASALLDPASPNRVRLQQLAADIATQDRGDLHLTALEGVYHRRTERLDLEGSIELTTGDGYRFATDSARIDLQQGQVAGERPVAGSGPAGTLAADRFEIREGGDVLRFEGRVRVTVQPRPKVGASL